MRVVITYVIPTVAIVLVMVLLLVQRKKAAANGDEKPLVDTTLTVILLGITGTIGVFAIVYAMDLLDFL